MGLHSLAVARTKILDSDASRVLRHYERIAKDFDNLFPDWRAISNKDAQILDQILKTHGVRTVLDCACGTGIQTLGLARLGYEVTGTDFSERMLRRARAKAEQEGLAITLAQSDFRELRSEVFGLFDAVICCGNSFTHLTREADFRLALANMNGVCNTPGLVIIEIRNYDRLKEKGRFFELRRTESTGASMVVVFDVREFRDDLVDVTSVFLSCHAGKWRAKRYRVRYTCLGEDSLIRYMADAGFGRTFSVDGLTGKERSDESDWMMVVGVKG